MMSEWRRRQYTFWPSHGNFVTVDLKSPAEPWAQDLEQRGFITRPVEAFGLPNHLRITVAPIPVLEEFFSAFDQVRRD
jgi:histidinol-phosphate aminotransferase